MVVEGFKFSGTLRISLNNQIVEMQVFLDFNDRGLQACLCANFGINQYYSSFVCARRRFNKTSMNVGSLPDDCTAPGTCLDACRACGDEKLNGTGEPVHQSKALDAETPGCVLTRSSLSDASSVSVSLSSQQPGDSQGPCYRCQDRTSAEVCVNVAPKSTNFRNSAVT